MKLNSIKQFRSKLTKLKLIETKIYKKNLNMLIKITDIITKLKKALHIIYKYHAYNKRILFVGIPTTVIQQLKLKILNQKHLYIPNSIWLNGIITNQKSCFKYIYKNRDLLNPKFSETLSQFNKKLDLMVILDSRFKDNLIKESCIAGIPTIVIGNYLEIDYYKSSYKIPGTFNFFKKKNKDNFFYLLLLATLKKANKFKKKPQLNFIAHKKKKFFKKKRWNFQKKQG